MKTRPSHAVLVVLFLVLAISPQTAGQGPKRAGEVSRVIPAVGIERGAQQLVAEVQTPVLWEDIIATRRMAHMA